MKKIFLLTLIISSILLAWCFNKIETTQIENDSKEAINDYNDKYLTAFWTEPYRDIEISWWIAKFSSPMYETNIDVPVNIRKDWDNYYFSWDELEWEFIKKDCLDWWKWDIHYYTVWIAKFRDYYYEWCWDDEEWIKMTDEEYEKTLYND